MKYHVAITGLAICRRVIEVEADDAEGIEAKALADARDEGPCGWELDALYDDGQPHSQLAVSEITDDNGNDHPIEGA